jgi:hypothetical protein
MEATEVVQVALMETALLMVKQLLSSLAFFLAFPQCFSFSGVRVAAAGKIVARTNPLRLLPN